MARPTEYSEEILQRAKEYRDKLPDGEVIHSIEGLAQYVGVSRGTIYNWGSQEVAEPFLDIVEEIREIQAKTLINKGLKNEFQPSITKVMLTKHGYREGTDVTTNDKDLPTPLLDVVRSNNSNQEDTEA